MMLNPPPTSAIPCAPRPSVDITMIRAVAGPGGVGNEEALTLPKYGAGVAERQAEWIVQPPATICEDVCAGLTLRR